MLTGKQIIKRIKKYPGRLIRMRLMMDVTPTATSNTYREVENDKNSIRTTECSRKARLMGFWTGSAPRGYKNHRTEADKRSTLIPTADAPLIIEAFERMSTGIYPADEVRRWLNSKGMKLSKNQFLNIIRNVTYTGKISVKPFKDLPATIVTGIHPSLVNDELFAAANQVLNGRRRKMIFKQDKSDLYPLKGHLKCNVHNLSLTGGKSKGRYGMYHYYLCTVKHERCKRYPVDWVHDVIEKKLGEIQLSAGIINSYKTILAKMFEVEDGDRKKSITHLKSELEKLETQKVVLQDHFLSQKVTTDEYREMKQRIDAKAFDIKNNLEDLEDQVAPVKEYLQHHIPMLENLLSFFQKSDGKTKNRILSCILEGKIHFEENKDAAITFTPAISILLNASKGLEKGKKEKEVKSDLLSYLAPAAGLEPATL
jgi:site-specific DNA recombinase